MASTRTDPTRPRAILPTVRRGPHADRGGPQGEAGGAGNRPLPEISEARVAQRFGELVDAGGSVPGFAIRHPAVALEMVRDIRTLPRVEVLLPPGPETEFVRRQMMTNRGSRRVTGGVSAVLAIPAEPGSYLEGHERATVRRKIRAAHKQGVSSRAVSPQERAAMLDLADQHERCNEREQYRDPDPHNQDLLEIDLWIATYDADDRPLTLAVIPIAGRFATLRYFRTLVAGQTASDARYLMSEAVAEALSARGVRYLVDNARPHWLPNGLRHFQRMVGFRLMRMSRPRIVG